MTRKDIWASGRQDLPVKSACRPPRRTVTQAAASATVSHGRRRPVSDSVTSRRNLNHWHWHAESSPTVTAPAEAGPGPGSAAGGACRRGRRGGHRDREGQCHGGPGSLRLQVVTRPGITVPRRGGRAGRPQRPQHWQPEHGCRGRRRLEPPPRRRRRGAPAFTGSGSLSW
jgi:hypothetical protein